jgi:hypothetical protein
MEGKMEAPIVRKTASFWCHGGTHDKVYRIEIQEFKGKFDVTGLYGRRGKALKLFVIAEGTTQYMSGVAYAEKVDDLLKKGYKRVVEDVATTSTLTLNEVAAWS